MGKDQVRSYVAFPGIEICYYNEKVVIVPQKENKVLAAYERGSKF